VQAKEIKRQLRPILVENAGRLARAAPARPETAEEEEAAMSISLVFALRVAASSARGALIFVAGGCGVWRRPSSGGDEAAGIVVGARLMWITCSGWNRFKAGRVTYGSAPLG
jgi:hypothetical protein